MFGGADLPSSGDEVQFQSQDTNRGLRASAIQLITRSEDKRRGDERVKCGYCGRKMVPRILSYQGQVERSVCPFCAGTHCDFSPPLTSSLWGWGVLAVLSWLRSLGGWDLESTQMKLSRMGNQPLGDSAGELVRSYREPNPMKS